MDGMSETAVKALVKDKIELEALKNLEENLEGGERSEETKIFIEDVKERIQEVEERLVQ